MKVDSKENFIALIKAADDKRLGVLVFVGTVLVSIRTSFQTHFENSTL